LALSQLAFKKLAFGRFAFGRLAFSRLTFHRRTIPNGGKINQHLPLQDPTKFTQIGIFGLKIYHLATLIERTKLFHGPKNFQPQISDTNPNTEWQARTCSSQFSEPLFVT
jgi:hypothetical protein